MKNEKELQRKVNEVLKEMVFFPIKEHNSINKINYPFYDMLPLVNCRQDYQSLKESMKTEKELNTLTQNFVYSIIGSADFKKALQWINDDYKFYFIKECMDYLSDSELKNCIENLPYKERLIIRGGNIMDNKEYISALKSIYSRIGINAHGKSVMNRLSDNVKLVRTIANSHDETGTYWMIDNGKFADKDVKERMEIDKSQIICFADFWDTSVIVDIFQEEKELIY